MRLQTIKLLSLIKTAQNFQKKEKKNGECMRV